MNTLQKEWSCPAFTLESPLEKPIQSVYILFVLINIDKAVNFNQPKNAFYHTDQNNYKTEESF